MWQWLVSAQIGLVIIVKDASVKSKIHINLKLCNSDSVEKKLEQFDFLGAVYYFNSNGSMAHTK